MTDLKEYVILLTKVEERTMKASSIEDVEKEVKKFLRYNDKDKQYKLLAIEEKREG